MAATLKCDTLQNASSATANITLDTAGNATVGNTLAMGSSFLRNRIINGDMKISQRGTSFSSPNGYTVDRWGIGYTGSAIASAAQVTGPTGYQYAMRLTGGTGNTLVVAYQRIEAANTADLVGKNVTISAVIFGSVSQNVNWALIYANSSDNFSASTVISSGSWAVGTSAQSFSATITNLPSGAANGLQLNLYPANGGGFTSGTVDITGVQLEVGSTATPFERRQYGQELALCQRYLPAFNATGSGQQSIGPAVNWSTTAGFAAFPFLVQPRVAPTGVTVVSTFQIIIPGVGTYTVTPSFGYSSLIAGNLTLAGTGLGTGTGIFVSNSATSQILFSGCEL